MLPSGFFHISPRLETSSPCGISPSTGGTLKLKSHHEDLAGASLCFQALLGKTLEERIVLWTCWTVHFHVDLHLAEPSFNRQDFLWFAKLPTNRNSPVVYAQTRRFANRGPGACNAPAAGSACAFEQRTLWELDDQRSARGHCRAFGGASRSQAMRRRLFVLFPKVYQWYSLTISYYN